MAAETPKSVSGMTRLMEPQIMRDFPEFSWEEFKHRAENMLTSALLAITSGDVTTIVDASDTLKEQIRNRIGDNEASGVKETFEQIKIHQTEISNYHKEKGTCVITIQSSVEYFYSKMRGDELIAGSKERKTQTKYNTELIYIQDSDLAEFDNAIGVSCPNCGALLVGVAAAKAISYARNIPLVGVHHIEGHISANYIENPELKPPFLCLVVSGGHTHLVKVKDYGVYEILGRTRDD